MKRGILLFLAITSFIILTAQNASADGMAFVLPQDSWLVMRENSQTAAINYENGVQKMLLAAGMANMSGQKAVWLFPVPGDPENVKINLVEKLPQLRGGNVTYEARRDVKNAFAILSATQVCTLPLTLLTGFSSMGAGDFAGRGVDIYEHIEKYGVTTELVGAEDANALYAYLSSKGLSLPPEAFDIIEGYIGKNYSFVVYWISDLAEYQQHLREAPTYSFVATTNIGVYVSFPTEKMFFPLKPTSIYGQTTIPIHLYVIGHAEPQFSGAISGSEYDTDMVYQLFHKNYVIPAELEDFFGRTGTANVLYTDIHIVQPSDRFVDDLWIDKKPDEEFYSKNALPVFIEVNILWLSIAWFLAASIVSSIAAAYLVFSKHEPSPLAFAALGLTNLLTIIGFIIASRKLIGPEDQAAKKEQNTLGKKLLFIVIAAVYLILVNFLFLSIMAGFAVLPQFFSFESLMWMLAPLFFLAIITVVIPVAVLAAIYHAHPSLAKFILAFSAFFMILNCLVYIAFASII
jgi:hypothetical protein